MSIMSFPFLFYFLFCLLFFLFLLFLYFPLFIFYFSLISSLISTAALSTRRPQRHSPHAHQPQVAGVSARSRCARRTPTHRKAAGVTARPHHATSSPDGGLHLPLSGGLLCTGSSPADGLPGLQLPQQTWRRLALHKTSPPPPLAWTNQICK
jgi:hypothetical protein